MERLYHIYIKNRCIYHSLNLKDFEEKWETLRNLVELLNTDYKLEDLSYEEVSADKRVFLESSH